MRKDGLEEREGRSRYALATLSLRSRYLAFSTPLVRRVLYCVDLCGARERASESLLLRDEEAERRWPAEYRGRRESGGVEGKTT